jgi:hypothetical protein
VQVRSHLWDLENRFHEWLDSYYPRFRWVQRNLLVRHRTYVMLLFGEKEPDGLGMTRPSPLTGEDTPWFMALCKGCRWERRYSDMDSALAAARDHSPHVRRDVLSALEPSEVLSVQGSER